MYGSSLLTVPNPKPIEMAACVQGTAIALHMDPAMKSEEKCWKELNRLHSQLGKSTQQYQRVEIWSPPRATSQRWLYFEFLSRDL